MPTRPLRYQHPGYAFLHRYGSLQTEEDVFHYVEFLRRSADLGSELPTNLDRVYAHFGMPLPLRVPLDEQQGILLDSFKGLILIKEDDPIVRQRFTEGHELMELLFDAQADVAQKLGIPEWDEARKEQLCDAGAAELLMPRTPFRSHLQHLGVSLDTARTLAKLYQTSLLATLVRMMELAPGAHALMICHRSLKPLERRHPHLPAQPKLRIWWKVTSPAWHHGFIPKNKSIDPTSLIYQAWATNQTQRGRETLILGKSTIDSRIEAMPLQIGNKPCVLALLHP